jgi:hypothetical protein
VTVYQTNVCGVTTSHLIFVTPVKFQQIQMLQVVPTLREENFVTGWLVTFQVTNWIKERHLLNMWDLVPLKIQVK